MNGPTAQTRDRQDVRRNALPLALALALAILAGMSLPTPGVPTGPIVGPDKIFHLLVFGLLATAALRTSDGAVAGRERALLAAAAVAIFSVATELLQSLLPWRYFEPADMVANFSGVAIATTLYLCSERYRRLLELRLR